MKFKKTYLTLDELGRLFGVSQKTVGKWLEKLGLRTSKGKPSLVAFSQNWVSFVQNRNTDDRHVWNAERTVAVFIENGMKSVVPPPTDLIVTSHLDGPFTIRTNSGSPNEIVGSNGEVAVWVSGDANARIVCRLLNVGHRLGVIESPKPEQQSENNPTEPDTPSENMGFVIYGVR